jgi:hypothetical protein
MRIAKNSLKHLQSLQLARERERERERIFLLFKKHIEIIE